MEANPPVRVNVAVIDAGGEVDLGGFEGVVGGEVNV